jgi:hypothetical protein
MNIPNRNIIVNASFTSMVSPPFEGKPCPPKIQLYLYFTCYSLAAQVFLLTCGCSKGRPSRRQLRCLITLLGARSPAFPGFLFVTNERLTVDEVEMMAKAERIHGKSHPYCGGILSLPALSREKFYRKRLQNSCTHLLLNSF